VHLELLVSRRREEDVRTPVEARCLIDEAGAGLDEVALQLDMETRFLVRLALHGLDEVLTGLHSASGRTPDVRWEHRLADQREALAVEDEQRDVVRAQGVVRRDPVLDFRDVTDPLQRSRLAVARAERREDLVGEVHSRS
jgi:hypothetical protein